MQFGTLTNQPRGTTVTLTPARAHAGNGRNIALWVGQGLLAALFLFAGTMKLVLPPETLAAQSSLPALFVQFIGLVEVLGAVGLVVPWAAGIRRTLTPLAAAGLVIVMVGATVVTATGGQVAPAAFPFLVGVIATVVAWGRFGALRRTSRRLEPGR